LVKSLLQKRRIIKSPPRKYYYSRKEVFFPESIYWFSKRYLENLREYFPPG